MSGGSWIERVRRSPSPSLRAQFAEAGVDPASFSLDDLQRLRPIRPAELDLDRLEDPVGHLRLADAATPSRLGTCERDGKTIVLTWTPGDLARSAAAGARALRAAGIRPGAQVANTLEGGLTTPGSLSLGDALEALGALDVPLGPAADEKSAAALVALIQRVGVAVLVIEPGTSRGLLSLLAARPPASLAGVVWTGDPSADPPEGLPSWRRRWLSVPEVCVFAAVECERGSLHVDPEIRAEALEGRLLFSSLGGDAPIFRYDSGIRGGLSSARCACGDSRVVVALN